MHPAFHRSAVSFFAGIVSCAVLSFVFHGHASAQAPPAARDLFVTVGKSLIVDSPVDVDRVSIADPKMAEAVVTSPREVVINGRAAGQTSLIVWQHGGNRLLFDLKVSAPAPDLDPLRSQLDKELPGQSVDVSEDNGYIFLRGTVNNLINAQRAVEIAATAGKPVDLLRVKVGAPEAQILVKIKFASVDRSTSLQLGANIFSLGATNTLGSVSTQQYSPPLVSGSSGSSGGIPGKFGVATISNALNLFLFRPDLNLGATIEALAARNLVQILAEPNLLAINGQPASFLAGGEFPYPTLQGGGAGLGAVTVAFREFGVRLNFTPVITPRGTIKLDVAPEVSSLDFANGLTLNGFTIPGIASRRAHTQIELQSGQSFAIAGLLDNRTTKSLSKIPGLGDIPFFGKLFQSTSVTRNNSEVLIIVTPELVRPIPAGQPLPALDMPMPFLKGAPQTLPRTPGMNVTGPVPVTPPQESIPVEQLIQQQQQQQPSSSSAGQPGQPSLQFVPMLVPQGSSSPTTNPNGPPAVVPPPQPAPPSGNTTQPPQ
jgi:pilus assembly protein CpaC